jgi:uncharacterized protein YdeI (YjbR/CyaY-like superfamily)
MPPSRVVAKEFEAVLERTGDRLNWTVIRVPLDVAKTWGVRGQLRVKGEVNGFPFQSSLFPDGKGSHFLMVNKKMQAEAKATPGMKARFRMEPDTGTREVKPPRELIEVLAESKRLKKFYESFSYSNRHWIARWVSEAKHSETRRRRAEQMAERLMLTMEAEKELPPVLRVALAGNPRAREGWDRMPSGQRRSHLMGIFYYRNPESQARRVSKALEAMVEYADKPTRKTRKTG